VSAHTALSQALPLQSNVRKAKEAEQADIEFKPESFPMYFRPDDWRNSCARRKFGNCSD